MGKTNETGERRGRGGPSGSGLGTGSQQSSPAQKSSDGSFAPPALTMPKGGGAVRGMGEKFAANPVNGTGSLSVPIPTSPERPGLEPKLSLSYDSGTGNGPFGLGWSLSLPLITRKTDKGLPKYRDAEGSDVFILSGAEDLVPVPDAAGGPSPERTVGGVEYRVEQYRPRVEGLFARIERWLDVQSGATHWCSITKDNVTTLYGRTAESRIADPAEPGRVFSWLICESYDDKGGAVRYEYKAENAQGVAVSSAHEQNRTDLTRSANRYPKRIKYGNRTPRQPDEDLSARTDWMFEVVFDYGEHYSEDEQGSPAVVFQEGGGNLWQPRQDPFSSYRSGFEVRTYRLCRGVLMFHHFPVELGIADYLVRATHFDYSQSSVASLITAVTQSGYLRQADGTYLKSSLPPIEFEYSQAVIDEEVREIDAESLENLPYGLDGRRYQWVDLDSEGLSGVLTEQEGAWFYKRNLSALPPDAPSGTNGPVARFGPAERVAVLPSPADLSGGRSQLLDLAGDGQLDFVQFAAPLPGFFERTHGEGWEPFAPFLSLPNLSWGDPGLKFIDLTGDGHADLLLAEDGGFLWSPSLAEDGFGSWERVRHLFDEEKAPRLVFDDGTESIYLADISGDGLTDLVRIRNGEVCYWPSLGYGRFGAKVTMDSAPWFDAPDQFEQGRVRLADIDGSGVTDIIYLGRDGIRLYFNRSGNSWSDARRLERFPLTDNLSSVTVVDLLGNGTACLVWSSPLPGHVRRPLRYVDLMGGLKPHLLVASRNNLGAETRVRYASSTRFYLEDRRAGRPWVTKLPFPVQVVERVEVYDHISRNRFVTRYAYHHGYFDGVEREFRGFGMVEQLDTEEFASLSASDAFPAGDNVDESSHVPPVLTKLWLHTGVYFEGGTVSRQFEGEYYRESDPSLAVAGLTDAQLRAMTLDDTVRPDTVLLADGTRLPHILSNEEAREACRALKGSILRREVYALDGTEEADRPYSVSERNYTVELLQPRAGNRHAVFFTHERETVDFHYERKLYDVGGQRRADPRVTHAITLEVDAYGNVLRSAAAGYGRRFDDPDPLLNADDRARQKRTRATYTESRYTDPVLLDDAYRAPLPCESRMYELLKVAPAAAEPLVTNLFRFDELRTQTQAAGDALHDLPYEDTDASGAVENHPYRRLIEHTRTLYRRDDLAGALPLGQVGSLALPFESYKLAFTPGLVSAAYEGRVTDAMLAGECGYVHGEGDADWWIPAGRVFFSPDATHTPAQELAHARQHFFLPRRYRNPFGRDTILAYDGFDLLLRETRDALGNVFTVVTRDDEGGEVVALDYRVLQPWMVTDPNGNRTAAAYDVLGMVTGTVVSGKLGEDLGDTLDGFQPQLTRQQIDDFFDAPLLAAVQLLGTATTRIVYDLQRFWRSQQENPLDAAQWQPAFAAIISRETHVSDLTPPEETRCQVGFTYSDGFEREIQKKAQAEAGPLSEGGSVVAPRWVGSGWTVFNNKGKPVRKYEPFFSATHRFEFARTVGVSPTIFYDPVERVVATLLPNHTYQKVIFAPWRQESWDANDTALVADPKNDPDVGDFFRRLPASDYLPTWHAQRSSGALGAAEQDAAAKTVAHADTPSVAHFDTQGRAFLTVADAGVAPDGTPRKFVTRVMLDIEGNQRSVIDAIGRVVIVYDYNLLGTVIHQSSMEAGRRWTLDNLLGNSARRWDSLGHASRTLYDALNRPARVFVQPPGVGEILVERLLYGETHAEAARNLRGNLYQHYDQAGVVTNERFDFKGNLLESSRRLARVYRDTADWSPLNELDDLQDVQDVAAPALEVEVFTSLTMYDALSRPLVLVSPHNATTLPNVVQPAYNDANLLDSVDVWLRLAAAPAAPLDPASADLRAVTHINYDAKGRRTLAEFGNGVTTVCEYDPLTFRLARLRTTRPNTFAADERTVQSLSYTYDPFGNITRIRDDADLQNVIYFRNQRVEPSADYTYDALYRLIAATGREHLGQAGGGALMPPAPPAHTDAPRAGLLHPGDGNAVGTYTESYEYDAVGNILRMTHQALSGAWIRRYAYEEPSLIEPALMSNRLSRTSLPGDSPAGPFSASYSYDTHGNMTRMPHLPLMRWNYNDQLRATSQQVVNDGTPETTYYVYDASGRRVRKVTDRQAAAGATPSRKEERVYFGDFEIYREYNNAGSAVALERETLHVRDDKQRVALIEMRTQGDDGSPARLIRYQFDNHLSSANLELDAQAEVISYEEYYPFGSTSYQAVDTLLNAAAKRYRHTGKERDDEIGLYCHGARYFAPWLGRWTSCDPAGTRDLVDLYVYVKNNPIKFQDATGADAVCGVYDEEEMVCRPEACPPMSVAPPPTAAPTAAPPPPPNVRIAPRRTPAPPPPAAAPAPAPAAAPPEESGSGWTRVVGGIQLAGGVLEAVGAIGLAVTPEPTMATKVGAVALGAHSIDTMSTGLLTLWTGEVQQTLTHHAGAGGAEALGASPGAANWAGTGLDLAAGAGPSIAVGLSRRMAVSVAEEGLASGGAKWMTRNTFGTAVPQGAYRPAGQVFGQATEYTCVAGSCRMIASDVGVVLNEAELAAALGTTEGGALLREAPAALAQFGVGGGVYRQGLGIGALESAVGSGRAAIVGVRVPGVGSHALVVDAVEGGSVLIRDPLPGFAGSAYSIAVRDFTDVWKGSAVTFGP